LAQSLQNGFFVKKLDIFERAIDKNIIFAAKYQTTNI